MMIETLSVLVLAAVIGGAAFYFLKSGSETPTDSVYGRSQPMPDDVKEAKESAPKPAPKKTSPSKAAKATTKKTQTAPQRKKAPAKPKPKSPSKEDRGKMTKAQLAELAAKSGLKLDLRRKKADLIQDITKK